MSRTRMIAVSVGALLGVAAVGVSQPNGRNGDAAGGQAPAAEAPASRPTTQPSADDLLGQMLKPRRPSGERELVPTDPPAVDRTSGKGAVSPHAPTLTVLREGTPIFNRVGRLTLGADGGPSEFVFESDGGALRDPPLIVLPNLKLMIMEDTTRGNTREPRFRVSGTVTEYRGRNYLLLDKVHVLSTANQQFR